MATRINKYLSEVGYCSRREADKLILEGKVTINGKIPEIGTKVKDSEQVKVKGQRIEKSNLLNCSYVLEISSQGVSDELTSERDFKTFKGFPVNVELNQKNSKIKFLSGLLYEKSKDYLAINIKGKIKKIPFDEVLKISLCTLKD